MIQEENKQPLRRLYRPAFDIWRVICVALLILIEFGLYFIPYFTLAQPFLYFAQGTLFTLYGYVVLRDGADLRRNIRHTLKAFLLMFLVYGVLTAGYCWLVAGTPWAAVSKRSIFNFVVLNVWPVSLGASIWYVQSTLYALVLFWLLRRFKKYDWLLCAVLFVAATLLGELAGVIHFDLLGYSYIPGNFFTKTMPYMLLGRLLHNYYSEIENRVRKNLFIWFLIGLVLCVAEFLALGITGNLVYPNHFIGFIPMVAVVCIQCVQHPNGGRLYALGEYAPMMYKGMFYTFNPLGYILLLAAGLLCQTQQQYNICQYAAGVVVLLLTGGAFWLAAFLKKKFKSYEEIQEREEGTSDETEI